MRKSNKYLLECREIPLLFKLLGRHRALRELAKARPMSTRTTTMEASPKSIMDRIAWSISKQGADFWASLYSVTYSATPPKTREELLRKSLCA
jgi:hypothetical protein